MAFKGTAFVTGAAQGIGLGIALRLADDGFDVAVNDVMQKGEALNGVVRQIRDKGRKGLGVLGDVSNEDDIKRMIAEVVRELDGLDVVSYGAGNSAPAGLPRAPDGRECGNSLEQALV